MAAAALATWGKDTRAGRTGSSRALGKPATIPTYGMIACNSTSKISVAFGPIGPPGVPFAP